MSNEQIDITAPDQKKDSWLIRSLRQASIPVAAVLLALLIGAVILAVSGANPIQALCGLVPRSIWQHDRLGAHIRKSHARWFSAAWRWLLLLKPGCSILVLKGSCCLVPLQPLPSGLVSRVCRRLFIFLWLFLAVLWQVPCMVLSLAL